ncbi:MAG: SLC13 family permease, partial [Patescibacteria group bacterium]
MTDRKTGGGTSVRAWVGLVAGPLLFALIILIAPPDGMSVAAWRTAAVGALMASWWITEAIPIPATALLPIVLFPLLGVATIAETTSPYANPVIYLFLGGFLIAMALESCGLHKRIALTVLGVVGTRPANLILGFMAATAFISMWVSNTATVVMLLPMATSVIALAHRGDEATGEPRSRAFDVALLLGIAYAANIGGLGTLIGTPPNALLAGFMSETYGVRIGFAEWMLLGVPIVVVGLPVAWLLLTRWLHPLGSEPIAPLGDEGIVGEEVWHRPWQGLGAGLQDVRQTHHANLVVEAAPQPQHVGHVDRRKGPLKQRLERRWHRQRHPGVQRRDQRQETGELDGVAVSLLPFDQDLLAVKILAVPIGRHRQWIDVLVV